jgi:hypothetical protein
MTTNDGNREMVLNAHTGNYFVGAFCDSQSKILTNSEAKKNLHIDAHFCANVLE